MKLVIFGLIGALLISACGDKTPPAPTPVRPELTEEEAKSILYEFLLDHPETFFGEIGLKIANPERWDAKWNRTKRLWRITASDTRQGVWCVFDRTKTVAPC